MAGCLTHGEQELEDGEQDLTVHWLPFDKLLALVLAGDMPHAGSVYAVLRLAAERAGVTRA